MTQACCNLCDFHRSRGANGRALPMESALMMIRPPRAGARLSLSVLRAYILRQGNGGASKELLIARDSFRPTARGDLAGAFFVATGLY